MKETLEEVAENYSKITLNKGGLISDKQVNGFIAGAKWQQEQDKNKYSEEEVLEILLKHQSDYRSTVRNTSPLNWSFDIKKWFEQFKKKVN